LVGEGSGRDKIIDGNDGVVWSPGDTIQFRVNVGAADFREPPLGNNPNADELEVNIIHTPSGTIISRNVFTP